MMSLHPTAMPIVLLLPRSTASADRSLVSLLRRRGHTVRLSAQDATERTRNLMSASPSLIVAITDGCETSPELGPMLVEHMVTGSFLQELVLHDRSDPPEALLPCLDRAFDDIIARLAMIAVPTMPSSISEIC